MKIGRNCFVSIDYTLTLDSGEQVDKSEPGAPLTFIQGAGQVIPGLERALEGLAAGESRSVVVEPGEGYGPSIPDLLQEIPASLFPHGAPLRPGIAFEASGPRGPMRFVIESVEGETITANFNHPLAGQRLHFDLSVIEVREATPGELSEAAEDQRGGCGCGQDDGCGGGCTPDGDGRGCGGSCG